MTDEGKYYHYDVPKPDRGPLQEYEITWKSGHVERIKAHQITWPRDAGWAGLFGGVATQTERDPRVMFHAELNGQWQPVLIAREEDIHTVRNCVTEQMHAEGWGQIDG